MLRHGGGPDNCDALGARDVFVWRYGGSYRMHYDGAGPKGWLACLATSRDLVHWQTKGPVLDLGKPGEEDSASASYGVTYFDGRQWHMFYMGTPHVTPAPDFIPAFPYLTMKARAPSPEGPWEKQPAVLPFRTRPGTFYSATASPGQVIRQGDEYLMFFSASADRPIKRTLGLARTKDLNAPWTVAPEPIVPPEEQIENSSLFYDDETKTWFLFTNHVGVEGGLEYTDAIWVYWSRDPTRWNRDHKAVVLDRRNCKWSKHIIGLPSVVKAGNRLAIFYDGNGSATMPRGVKSHMDRDVGLAWLGLPLIPPAGDSATRSPRKGEMVYQADFEGADALSGWSGPAALEAGYCSAQAVALETNPNTSGAVISRRLPAEALRGCRIRGSAMVRAEQVSPKPNPWNGIKFMLVAESPAGSSYPQASLETGTFDWRPAAFTASVPADATNLTLVLGLEQVTGKVWFDDLRLTVVRAPLTVQPEPVAGPLYKGHSLPRLRGAMVSPGIDSESLRVLGQDWKANLIRFQLVRSGRAGRASAPGRSHVPATRLHPPGGVRFGTGLSLSRPDRRQTVGQGPARAGATTGYRLSGALPRSPLYRRVQRHSLGAGPQRLPLPERPDRYLRGPGVGLELPRVPGMERLERGARLGPPGHASGRRAHGAAAAPVRLVRPEPKASLVKGAPGVTAAGSGGGAA